MHLIPSFTATRTCSYHYLKTLLIIDLLLLTVTNPLRAGLADGRHDPLVNTEKLILSNPDSAFIQIQKLLKDYSSGKDEYARAICYRQLGKIFHNQGAYDHALEYYYKADPIFRKEKNLHDIAENLVDIGQAYDAARLKGKCKPIYEKALNIFKKLGENRGIGQTYGLLGQLYENTKHYTTDLKYQFIALEAYKRSGDTSGIAKIYENIASVYEDHDGLELAFRYYLEALQLNQAVNNLVAQTEILNNIGDYYRKTGALEKALFYTRKANKLAIQLNDKRQESGASRDLAKTFHLMGNHDSSYYYSVASDKAYHKIFQKSISKHLNLLHTLFEMNKKDDEILQLESERQINRILTGAVVLICILLLGLGYSVVSRQRLKNRDEKILFEAQRNTMEAELRAKQLEQQELANELEAKIKELAGYTLHVLQKNQLLEDLKIQLNSIVKSDKRDHRKDIRQIVNLIDSSKQDDKNWEDFRVVFERVHTGFFNAVAKQAAHLTASDLRLLALLKMNLDNQDIATVIGISAESLRTTKYRLRQKLQLPEGETLLGFVQKL